MRTVTLKHDTHQYFDDLGREYMSATRFLGSYKEAFDAHAVAPLVARSRKKKLEAIAKKKGVSLKEVQAMQPKYERGCTVNAVLKEWDAKRDDANAKGSHIHDNLEAMLKTGQMPPKEDEYYQVYVDAWKWIKDQDFYKLFPEVILHSERVMVAGMADLRCQRTRSGKSVVDYFDYKTNVIGFDSVKRTETATKHYNRFMNYPLEHLEDCEYNKYALQLSLYAYMDQMMFGTKIGRLAILNVVDGFSVIPVPYMKMEIELLMRHKELQDETGQSTVGSTIITN